MMDTQLMLQTRTVLILVVIVTSSDCLRTNVSNSNCGTLSCTQPNIIGNPVLCDFTPSHSDTEPIDIKMSIASVWIYPENNGSLNFKFNATKMHTDAYLLVRAKWHSHSCDTPYLMLKVVGCGTTKATQRSVNAGDTMTITYVPRNISAIEHSNVTWQVKNANQWTPVFPRESHSRVYEPTFNGSIYRLTISGFGLEDAGSYRVKCGVGDKAVTNAVTVSVLTPPGRPLLGPISQIPECADCLAATANSWFYGFCYSNITAASRPVDIIIRHGVKVIETCADTSNCTFHKYLYESDHLSTMICSVKNGAIKEEISTTERVFVIGCTPGFYGEGCKETCGHCRNMTDCAPVSGTCFSGCLKGYIGDKCVTASPDLLQRVDVTRSVTMSSSSQNLTGEKAYDGNPSRDPEQCQCCSQTLNSESSWWMVAFQHKYPITKISIHGRNNENTYHHISGFSVDLANITVTKTTWKTIYIGDTSDVKSDFEINALGEIASAVRVRRAGVLTLCEIKILEGDCRTGWFGEFCSQRCHCADALPCDRLSGTCQTPVCDVGWLGHACNRSSPGGTYGQRCEQKCNCMHCSADYGVCEEMTDDTSSSILPVALGASFAGVVLVILISAIIVVVRNRLLCFRSVYASPERKAGTEADTYDTLQPSSDAPVQMEERHTYYN